MQGVGAVLTAALGLGLGLLVTWERLVIIDEPGPEQTAIWLSGLIVVFCVVSGRWIRLDVRAGIAAAVSWLTTAGLLVFGPVGRSWGLGESLALGILLAQVVRTLPAPQAAGLGLALGTAAIVAPVRDENPGPITAVLGVLTLCVAAAFAYVRVLDAQRASAVERARSKERLTIARELHDLVAHHITGIVIQTNAIRLVPDEPDRISRMLDDIEAAGAQAMTAMRRLVVLLRDDSAPPLDPGSGLAGVVADIAADTAALTRSGVRVSVDIDPDLKAGLPSDVAGDVHRIVREALTNVGKHGHEVSRVWVRVGRGIEGGIDIEVTDNGRTGGDSRFGAGGFGLIGLGERVTELGGTIQSGHQPGGGWRLAAHLPDPLAQP